jgi:hypothetical protein
MSECTLNPVYTCRILDDMIQSGVNRLMIQLQHNLQQRRYLDYAALLFPWFRSRSCTKNVCLFLLRRVLYPPFAGVPQGLTGCTLPFDLPRPPPWGWSAIELLV